MRRESAFNVEGTVVDVLPSGAVWVGLVNGHRAVGHIVRKQDALFRKIKTGMTVNVKLTPCDLSHGQINLKESQL